MVKNQRNSCCHMGCPPMIGDLHFHRRYSLTRIIHQPKKSTRENPFGGQMILTTLISQDHHAPKARSSDGLDSVQSGLSVVSRRTSSWQPPRLTTTALYVIPLRFRWRSQGLRRQ